MDCQVSGTVASVRGSVVDMHFEACLPPIYSLLHAKDGKIAIEVLVQLDAHHVRGIALTPTQGLARGMAVLDTGGPLLAPVGKNILSRMFDVFGNAIDRREAPADVQWRSIHQAPPTLARRSTKSEIFETGIKAIDVLVPLERGGKAGLFGGAGVWIDRGELDKIIERATAPQPVAPQYCVAQQQPVYQQLPVPPVRRTRRPLQAQAGYGYKTRSPSSVSCSTSRP